MVVQALIEKKLSEGLSPVFLQVDNESYLHNVPENAETHFKVVIAADAFVGQRAVQRHQEIYRLLAEELQKGVHALAIHAYTPQDWQAQGQAPTSPECLGG
mgnify:FL=1